MCCGGFCQVRAVSETLVTSPQISSLHAPLNVLLGTFQHTAVSGNYILNARVGHKNYFLLSFRLVYRLCRLPLCLLGCEIMSILCFFQLDAEVLSTVAVFL